MRPQNPLLQQQQSLKQQQPRPQQQQLLQLPQEVMENPTVILPPGTLPVSSDGTAATMVKVLPVQQVTNVAGQAAAAATVSVAAAAAAAAAVTPTVASQQGGKITANLTLPSGEVIQVKQLSW